MQYKRGKENDLKNPSLIHYLRICDFFKVIRQIVISYNISDKKKKSIERKISPPSQKKNVR